MFVAGVGTGGTITGVGRRLKETDAATKTVAVEPHEVSKIQGLRCLDAGYIPSIVDLSVIDERVYCEDEDAFATAKRLMKEE